MTSRAKANQAIITMEAANGRLTILYNSFSLALAIGFHPGLCFLSLWISTPPLKLSKSSRQPRKQKKKTTKRHNSATISSRACHSSPFVTRKAKKLETQKTENDSHLSPFRVFLDIFGQKTPKRTVMTNLGFPGLSSHCVSGFLGPFRPENPETDLEDNPGLP